MYSQRLSWSVEPNRYSRELEQMRLAGVPLLDLASSNPTTADPEYPHDAIARALGSITRFTYEPDPAGAIFAREAISAFYADRGIDVPPDRIFLTASTSEAYGLLFKLLCDPADEILIPLPSYPLFEYLAALENVRTVPYWLRYDGLWHIDFSTIEAALTERTRAIVVVNPNNPTGSFVKQDEQLRLMALARERNIPVISDEVFSDYTLDPATPRTTFVNEPAGLTFSLNGLSKVAGMPQMKLGWIVISGPGDQVVESRRHLELVLDTYLSVNSPVQQALPQLLAVGDSIRSRIRNRTARNLEHLKDVLRDSPASVLHTEAGWSAILQVPRTHSEEEWVMRLLQDQHVIVQPGYFFDMHKEAYLVLSLLPPQQTFSEGVGRIRSTFSAV